jgi:ABC-type sugar transport system ATPase subunit
VFEGTEQPAPLQPGAPAYQLGVRPSDIRLGSGPLTGVVDVVESLGHEALVHLSLGPHAVRALTPEPTHWRPGDALALELLKTHPFATQGGVRLQAAS